MLSPLLLEARVTSQQELDEILGLYSNSNFSFLSGLQVVPRGRKPGNEKDRHERPGANEVPR